MVIRKKIWEGEGKFKMTKNFISIYIVKLVRW